MKYIPKLKLKKLRGREYISVDQQILLWRRRNRKAKRGARIAEVAKTIDILYHPPGCPTIDDQPSPSPTPSWNMFEES